MIVVDHVTKYYGAHAAVRDLSFSIEEGECVGFLGLNGAGKSTTLRLLSCLLLPTSGRITIRGIDAEDEPHRIREFIGFLPDRPPVYEEMRVAEYLAFAGRLRRMSKQDVAKRLPEVIDLCGLNDVADQGIGTLSHGYRQRVGIAQAVVHRPALLILDEPIQGLDPVQIVEMREMIRSLRGEHTILLSTHILSEIAQTCDRILMLHRGHIAAQGTEEELAAKHGQHVFFTVEVRPTDGALHAARSVLEGVEGVREVTVASDEPTVARLRVQAVGDLRSAAAKALVGAGLELLALERQTTGLEAIFVELSRGLTPGETSLPRAEVPDTEEVSP